jgi:hypothetical protein
MYVTTYEIGSYILGKNIGNCNIYLKLNHYQVSFQHDDRKGWCGYRPSISHFHVFHCVTFVHVPKEARTKLDSKGVKCIFVGYCEETKGYILYNLIKPICYHWL